MTLQPLPSEFPYMYVYEENLFFIFYQCIVILLTDKLVPAVGKLCMIGQTSLHHIEAVGGAGPDSGQTLAGRATAHAR